MLLVHRDSIGNLTAALEYQVVDGNGKLDPKGLYIWFEQLEVNHIVNAKEHIARFILDIYEINPQVLGGYFVRKLKTGDKPHAVKTNVALQVSQNILRGGIANASV